MKRNASVLLFSLWMMVIGLLSMYGLIKLRLSWGLPGPSMMGHGILGPVPFFIAGIVGVVNLFLILLKSPAPDRLRTLETALPIYARAFKIIIREKWIVLLFSSLALLRVLGEAANLVEFRKLMAAGTSAAVGRTGMDLATCLWFSADAVGQGLRHWIVPDFPTGYSGWDFVAFAILAAFVGLLFSKNALSACGESRCVKDAVLFRNLLVPIALVSAILMAVEYGLLDVSMSRQAMVNGASNSEAFTAIWEKYRTLFTLSGPVFTALSILVEALLLGGVLGWLMRRRNGASVSLGSFSADSVRYFKPMTGVCLLLNIQSIVSVISNICVLKLAAGSPVSGILLINQMEPYISVVVLALMFSPFAVVADGDGCRAAFMTSLRFWVRKWWEIISFVGVGVSLTAVPIIAALTLSDIVRVQAGRMCLFTVAASIPQVLFTAWTMMLFLVGFSELYAQISEKENLAIKQAGEGV